MLGKARRSEVLGRCFGCFTLVCESAKFQDGTYISGKKRLLQTSKFSTECRLCLGERFDDSAGSKWEGPVKFNLSGEDYLARQRRGSCNWAQQDLLQGADFEQ